MFTFFILGRGGGARDKCKSLITAKHFFPVVRLGTLHQRSDHQTRKHSSKMCTARFSDSGIGGGGSAKPPIMDADPLDADPH